MIELNETILKALDGSAGQPLRLVDPRSGIVYLLLRADLLERMGEDEEDEPNSQQRAILLTRAMREEDEGDPHLASYQ